MPAPTVLEVRWSGELPPWDPSLPPSPPLSAKDVEAALEEGLRASLRQDPPREILFVEPLGPIADLAAKARVWGAERVGVYSRRAMEGFDGADHRLGPSVSGRSSTAVLEAADVPVPGTNAVLVVAPGEADDSVVRRLDDATAAGADPVVLGPPACVLRAAGVPDALGRMAAWPNRVVVTAGAGPTLWNPGRVRFVRPDLCRGCAVAAQCAGFRHDFEAAIPRAAPFEVAA